MYCTTNVLYICKFYSGLARVCFFLLRAFVGSYHQLITNKSKELSDPFHGAQKNTNKELKIFLDCNICDNTYIRQNLGNVEFVRDQNLSDVHLFFVSQRNGSGGRSYEIDFIGKEDLAAINYKIEFSTDTT